MDQMERFDIVMRLLAERESQALVAFLLQNATYQGQLDREAALAAYDEELSHELRAYVLNADALYHVLWDDEPIVLHLEFQRYGQDEVPRKIWACNALTSIVTGKPVYSVMIYALPEPSMPEPVYQTRLPNGQVNLSFSFQLVKLWEVESVVFEQPQFAGLLSLLPLTKGGPHCGTADAVEEFSNLLSSA